MKQRTKIYSSDKIRATGWIGEVTLDDPHERYPLTYEVPVEQSVFTIEPIIVGEIHAYHAHSSTRPSAHEAAVS